MKIEEIIGSLLDQIDDRESLIPPDDPDSIFKHDAEALREAVKILRAVEKEEKRIEVVGKVCGNCAKWEWTLRRKTGASAPCPSATGRGASTRRAGQRPACSLRKRKRRRRGEEARIIPV